MKKLKLFFLFLSIFCLILALQVAYGIFIENSEQNSSELSLTPTILSFKDIHNKAYSWPENFPGKTIIFFWASWCSLCHEEIKSLNHLIENHSQEYRALGINIDDSREDLEQFLVMNKVKFPILYDLDKKLATKFDVEELPTSFIFQNGSFIKKLVGEIGFDD